MATRRETHDALSVLLPSADETALLEASLHRGKRAAEAWDRWRRRRGPCGTSMCEDLAIARTLLPLLARSASRNSLDFDPDVLAYVRAVALREELRSTRFRTLAARALAALTASGTTVYVVRGAALAATVYESWSLRHCHDLDVLVPAGELAPAVHALTAAGFVAVGSTAGVDAGARLEHPAGLNAAVHTRPFEVPYYAAPFGEFTRRGQTVDIDGVTVLILSPEATMVHVLGHATYSASRRNIRWVSDAWHLVAAHDLDWSDVVGRVAAYRLPVPVAILVSYMSCLGARIPGSVVERLRTMAAAADRAAEDVAIGGVHATTGSDTRRLWRATTSWRGRMRLIQWAIVPSIGYMRSTFSGPRVWLYPLYYVYRPVRFLVARFRRRPKALPRGAA